MSDTIFEAEVVVVKNKFEPKSIRRIEVDTKEEAQAYIADLKEKLGNAVVGTRITRHVTESFVEIETGLLDRSDKIVIDSPAPETKPEPAVITAPTEEPISIDLVSDAKDQIVVEAVKAMDNNYFVEMQP